MGRTSVDTSHLESRLDQALDQALAHTFPASDPIALTIDSRSAKQRRRRTSVKLPETNHDLRRHR